MQIKVEYSFTISGATLEEMADEQMSNQEQFVGLVDVAFNPVEDTIKFIFNSAENCQDGMEKLGLDFGNDLN